MNDRKSQNPNLTPGGRAGREARQDRLAEALRDNLRRRKAQARGRASATAGPEDGDTAPGRPAGDGTSGGEA